jgi:hypothetical protein
MTTLPCWLLKVMSSPVTRLRALKSGAMVPTAGPDGTSVALMPEAEKMSPKTEQSFHLRSMRFTLACPRDHSPPAVEIPDVQS